MEICKMCDGDGLIKQGESIRYTCSNCLGTGKVEDLASLINEEKNMEEEIVGSDEVEVIEDESFLEDSSEDSDSTSEEVL